jgi:hypothetical protein
MNFNSEGYERNTNGSENDFDSQENSEQEGVFFEALYPAIQDDWGLPNDIRHTHPSWVRATSHAEIERLLKKVRNVSKVPIGRRLATYIAMWAVWRRTKDMSAGSDDWDVIFLRRAISGRVPQLVQWAIEHPSPYSDLAVKGIRMVYDFQWPHNASCGYIFYALWGWLQLELRKPGEKKPATIAEQMAFLTRDAERRGEKVVGWRSLGGGGVMAVTEPKNK